MGLCLLCLFLFLFRLANLITFGRKRVGRFLCQSDEIDALHVAINVCKFFLAEARFEISGGTQQQIFPIVAEDGFAGSVPIIGYGRLLFAGQRVQIDARHAVFLGTRPGDPLAVGRPVVAVDFAPFVLIHQGDRPCGNIDVAQPLQSITPEQLLAVGRPFRGIVIGVRAAGDLDRLALAVLRTHIQLVLTGDVGVVCNPFAIRRPDSVAFVGSGTVAQIAWGAMFCRHREKLAARHDNGAFAVRGEIHRFEMFGGINQTTAAAGEIFLDLDGHRRRPTGVNIVTPDVTGLLEHD